MTTNRAEPVGPRGRPNERRESVAEQARRRGIYPIQSVADLAEYGAFETDEELDAFLAHVRAERQANLA